MGSELKRKKIFVDAEVTAEAENRSKVNPLGDGFDLKSEYYEKDIKVSKALLESEQNVVTKVKVHKTDDQVVEIDAAQIKQVIKESKDIKQVVVEKISLEEATRYSLLFAPRHAGSNPLNLLEDHQKNVLEMASAKIEGPATNRWSFEKLEAFINDDFLTTDRSNASLEGSDNVIHLNERSDDKIDTGVSDANEKEVIEPVVEKKPEVKGRKLGALNFKIKDKKVENVLATHNSMSVNDDIDKNLKYQKHTLTKKKNRSNKSFYYRAKDHMELYKIGTSYLNDFKAGLKSFSFSSNGIKEEREKTVFGICSFFNYHEDLNICILTSDLKSSFYEHMFSDYEDRELQVFDEDLYLNYRSAKGFDLVVFKDLKKVERKIRDYDFETFVDYLSDRYDLLLWDLPECDVLDANKELYFPIIRTLDNVSFIVKKDVSKFSIIDKMVSYFNRYQVSIKGLLYSNSDDDHSEDKS